jgi:hypothetical protein
MANRNIKVIGHWQDANGKTMLHYSTSNQFLLSNLAMLNINGGEYPDPNAVQTRLSGAGKGPSGGTWVTTAYQCLDAGQVPAGIL